MSVLKQPLRTSEVKERMGQQLFEEKFFSKRTAWPRHVNVLTKIYQECKTAGHRIYDLTESNPTGCGFNYPAQIFEALSDPSNCRYNPRAKGLSLAREALRDYYRSIGCTDLDVEKIFLTASTSEAYTFLFRLLGNNEDQILCPRPSYPLFDFLVSLNDLELVPYDLTRDKIWHIDFEGLENAITESTKAIILVHPNNPTGSFVKNDEISRLNELCLKKNLALIVDEVFLNFSMQENDQLRSFVKNDGALTFVLGGLSKSLGLPQMKLSWIIVSGPQALVAEAIERLEIVADTFLSVNTPVQNGLPRLLEHAPFMQDQILVRVRKNYSKLQEAFKDHPRCDIGSVEGGWYGIITMSESIDEEQFVCQLLEEDHVYVHPGYFFEFKEGKHLILSLLPKADIFEEGLMKIKNRLAYV